MKVEVKYGTVKFVVQGRRAFGYIAIRDEPDLFFSAGNFAGGKIEGKEIVWFDRFEDAYVPAEGAELAVQVFDDVRRAGYWMPQSDYLALLADKLHALCELEQKLESQPLYRLVKNYHTSKGKALGTAVLWMSKDLTDPVLTAIGSPGHAVIKSQSFEYGLRFSQGFEIFEGGWKECTDPRVTEKE